MSAEDGPDGAKSSMNPHIASKESNQTVRRSISVPRQLINGCLSDWSCQKKGITERFPRLLVSSLCFPKRVTNPIFFPSNPRLSLRTARLTSPFITGRTYQNNYFDFSKGFERRGSTLGPKSRGCSLLTNIDQVGAPSIFFAFNIKMYSFFHV